MKQWDMESTHVSDGTRAAASLADEQEQYLFGR